MSLIDTSYFVGEFAIPNLSGTTNPAVAVTVADLNWFITKYEKEYLINIMGETMYNEFIAALAGTPETKWTALQSELMDSTAKISPITAYVWYAYRHHHVTQSGSFGESTAKTENASHASSTRKLIDAWNTAMRGASSVSDFIQEHITDYPNYDNSETVISYLNDFGI